MFPSVAHREHAGRAGPGEEEVGVAVLVDVGRRHRGVVLIVRQAGLRRGVFERAVTHVAIEERLGALPRQQQVDVPTVVEVGRNDGHALDGGGKPGRGGDVGEGAVPVVAPQPEG